MTTMGYMLMKAVGGLFRLGWRWWTGAPLDGKVKTNAGWFAAGSKALTPNGRAIRWAFLPRATRAAIRGGGSLGAVGLLLLYAMWPQETVVASWVALAGAAVWGGYAAVQAVQGWKHQRTYVEPLVAVLAPMLGYATTGKRDWLILPRDFKTNSGAPIRVVFPRTFQGADRDRLAIANTVMAKLGISSGTHDATFHMVGMSPSMTITAAPRAPKKVPLASVLDLIANSPEPAPLIGIGPRNKVVSVHLEEDSPHILINSGPGGGKSSLASMISAQFMAHGAFVVTLDVKGGRAWRWTRGLSNAQYIRDIGDIHNALIELNEITKERNHRLDEMDDVSLFADPRIVINIEEMNSLMNRLRAHWNAIREPSDPKVSPALDALNELVQMGREPRITIVSIAQMATARAMGGTEIRGSFGTRIMARVDAGAWKMLTGMTQMPVMSRTPGRVYVVIGSIVREAQAAFGAAAELVALATSGRVYAGAKLGQSQGVSPGAATTVDPATLGRPEPDEDAGLVGLREACEREILRISLANARKKAQNDPDFPRPVPGKFRAIRGGRELLYRADELARWQRNRPGNVPTQEAVHDTGIGDEAEEYLRRTGTE